MWLEHRSETPVHGKLWPGIRKGLKSPLTRRMGCYKHYVSHLKRDFIYSTKLPYCYIYIYICRYPLTIITFYCLMIEKFDVFWLRRINNMLNANITLSLIFLLLLFPFFFFFMGYIFLLILRVLCCQVTIWHHLWWNRFFY